MRRVDGDIRALKKALRRQCQERRAQREPGFVAEANRALLERLLELEEYAAAQWVHTYVSVAARNEVDTLAFIEQSLERDKCVVVPVVERGERALRHARIGGLEELQKGYFDLLQPRADRATWCEDLNVFDLVVVPALAFDRRGGRLGYGGGYYDRFLSQTRGFKIGLTYDGLLQDEIPLAAHDVPVDIVVTNSTIYRGGVS